MIKIVIVFALVASAQIASALNCYVCQDAKCREDKSKWEQDQTCGNTITDQTKTAAACLTYTYTGLWYLLKFTSYDSLWYVVPQHEVSDADGTVKMRPVGSSTWYGATIHAAGDKRKMLEAKNVRTGKNPEIPKALLETDVKTVKRCVTGDKKGSKIDYGCKDLNGTTVTCKLCYTDLCNS